MLCCESAYICSSPCCPPWKRALCTDSKLQASSACQACVAGTMWDSRLSMFSIFRQAKCLGCVAGH